MGRSAKLHKRPAANKKRVTAGPTTITNGAASRTPTSHHHHHHHQHDDDLNTTTTTTAVVVVKAEQTPRPAVAQAKKKAGLKAKVRRGERKVGALASSSDLREEAEAGKDQAMGPGSPATGSGSGKRYVLGRADYVELVMGTRRKAREEAAKLPRGG